MSASFLVENSWVIVLASVPIALGILWLLKRVGRVLSRGAGRLSENIVIPAASGAGRLIGKTILFARAVGRNGPPMVAGTVVVAILLARVLLPLLVVIALLVFIF